MIAGRKTARQTKVIRLPNGLDVEIARPSVASMMRVFGTMPLHTANPVPDVAPADTSTELQRTIALLVEHFVDPVLVTKRPEETTEHELSLDEMTVEDVRFAVDAVTEFSSFVKEGEAVRPSSPTSGS